MIAANVSNHLSAFNQFKIGVSIHRSCSQLNYYWKMLLTRKCNLFCDPLSKMNAWITVYSIT